MKNTVKNDKLGEIVYEESFWTGKKNLTINGKPITKLSKDTFKTEDEQTITLKGNYLYGTKATIGGEIIELTPTVKWYEIVLSLLPFIVVLVWGNVVALCQIIPIVGGAIGGLVSGIITILNLLVIKGIKQIWLKIIVSLAMLVAAFLICYLIALVILSMHK